MKLIVITVGILLTLFVEADLLLCKYLFVTKKERTFTNNSKHGKATVKYYGQDRYTDDNSPATSNTPMVDLFDENGNSLGGQYSLDGSRPNVGETVDVIYIEYPIIKYSVRTLNCASNIGKVLNITMGVIAFIGIFVTAIVCTCV